MNGRKVIKGICFGLIFLAIFLPLQAIFQPKWIEREGASLPVTAAWNEYRSLEENTIDVFFVGTSHIYFGIDPMYIYEHTGITSYAQATQSQHMDTAYLVLQEALKTQKPKVVFLDVSAIAYRSAGGEARAHKTLDQVPITAAKIIYAFNNGNKAMKPLDVLFPFFRYHSRWSDLTIQDFSYLVNKPEGTFDRGHYPTYISEPVELSFYEATDFSVRERDISYMKKIKKICDDMGAKLVLIKVPAPPWRKAMSETAEEIAQLLDVPFIEMYYDLDEIGLDAGTDFRDKTDHMNQLGAEKVTAYVIKYIQDNFDLKDQRDTNQRWNDDLAKYKAELQALQEQQIP